MKPGDYVPPTPAGLSFFMAGEDSTGWITNNDRYDGATDSWSARTAVPAAARETYRPECASDGSDYIFIWGCGDTDTDRYSNTGDSWLDRGRCNGETNGQAGYGDSKAFSCGGTNSSTCEEYTDGNNKWADVTSLPANQAGGGYCTISGEIYVYYGSSVSEPCYSYTTTGDSWTTETSGPTSNLYQTCGAAIGAYAYSFGGNIVGTGPEDANDEYYTTDDSWTSETAMPGPLRYPSGGNMGQDFAQACFGFTTASNNSWSDLNYLYCQSDDSWTTETSQSPARRMAGYASI